MDGRSSPAYRSGQTPGSTAANVYQSAHVNTAGSTTSTPQLLGLDSADMYATGICHRASLGSRGARQVGWVYGLATGAVIGWLWHGPDRYGHGLSRHAHADERAASTVTWGTTAPRPALAVTRGVLTRLPRESRLCSRCPPWRTRPRGGPSTSRSRASGDEPSWLQLDRERLSIGGTAPRAAEDRTYRPPDSRAR